jgi:peroxiredoxin
MAAWKDGGESYEVGKDTAKLQNRECWAIEVSNNFGRKRMLWVDKSSQAIVVLEERVFMGQGNEFTLRMQLESAEGLDKDQLARLRQPLDMLLKLQNDLKRPDDATDWEMSDAQLAIAAKELPAIEKASEGTPFSRLVSFAQRDTKNQLQRGDEVVQLAQKSIGRPAPDFSLPLLDGGTFEHKDLAGKITILHFWEYQGEPLVEPYGQVGYLDFLMSRRKKLGVQAIGVAVDNRFAKKELAPQAARSVGKLKSFMNLTYPIAGDGGAVLEKFGDPRRFEAKLPLWIVIGPDGKIAGYHVGYYDIKPDEGLRQLDEIVVKLIQAERAKDTK